MNDVNKLARATKNSFDKVDKQFSKVNKQFVEVRRDMKAMESRMDKKMDNIKDEIIREFNVVAENIHQDVAGANKDEISLIKQKQTILTKRVTRVEHKVGV